MKDANFVWRLAKGTYYLSLSQIDGASRNKKKRKELVYEFKELAGLALKLDDNNWNTHKWFFLFLYQNDFCYLFFAKLKMVIIAYS